MKIIVGILFALVVALLQACLPPPDGCQPFTQSCRGNVASVCSSSQRYSALPGAQPCDKIGNGALVCCQHRSPATGRLVYGCALPGDCVSPASPDADQSADAAQE